MKKLIFALISILFISCTIENVVEPTPVSISNHDSSSEFPVKYVYDGYRHIYDSTGVNSSNKYFVDSILVWESAGQYHYRYREEDKWFAPEKNFAICFGF
jgi:hypothetical protein